METFFHGGFGDGGVGGEAGDGPVAVVKAVAEAAVCGGKGQERGGEGAALGVGPGLLEFVEDGDVGEIGEVEETQAVVAGEVVGGGDSDAAQPAGEGGGVAKIGETLEGAEVGVLGGVEGVGGVLEDAVADGVDHVLRGGDELCVGGEVAGLGLEDEGLEVHD